MFDIVSTLLEILVRPSGGGETENVEVGVSTLLEILAQQGAVQRQATHAHLLVSTLLEILARLTTLWPSRRSLTKVSTLLEILGLVCLVVVGF